MPARIEDYALIGDCETAALVARDGSIDWLCWPRFDSDACFAALLGEPEHGRWRLAAADEQAAVTRRYLGETLVLETRIETAAGSVLVTDFMPPRGTNSDIVRIVAGERGEVAMRTELVVRFGYGASIPWVRTLEDGTLQAIAGPDMVVLRTDVELRGEDMKTVGDFTVAAGQRIAFVLTYGPSHLPPPAPIDPEEALADTIAFWSDWSGRCTEAGDWSAIVKRSLVTLKALTYQPTGGIVAAPTTSLPEQLGGTRNWDYRYCWLRDATLSLFALMNGGYYDEARSWRDWLVRAAAGAPDQLQIMYGLAGERRLTEWEAPWLPGYEGARPVRIGNAAHSQLQLDVFGEVMGALYLARKGGLDASEAAWSLQKAVLAHLETIWREPDEGLWESRGPRQHFIFSKVMCWLAFDRAVQSAEEFDLDGPVDRWRELRSEIHDEVCRDGFDRGLNAFTQAYGSPQLDASVLLLPMIGFLPPDDPRILGTVAAVERRLMPDGFVMRYDTAETVDGLPPGEGAFLACSFWLVEAYVAVDRLAEAEALFERLIALRNDLGLLAEEYDVAERRLVGNFPQAFSHVALVNAAYALTRRKAETEGGSDWAPGPSGQEPEGDDVGM